MKIGDKVRFLNDVGGGVVAGFQSKDVVIIRDENGFEIPTLARECVVIETDDYNMVRPSAPAAAPGPLHSAPVHAIEEDDERPVTFKPRPLERRGGDVLNVFLAFVADDLKNGDATTFEAYLVNDCNYTLRYALLSHEGAAVSVVAEGEAEANTKVFLAEFVRTDAAQWERVTLQAVAFKRDKSFLPKAPLNVGLRVDATKFYKLHTFTDSDFFDEPSLLVDIVRDDRPVRSVYVEAGELQEVLVAPRRVDRPATAPARKEKKDDPSKPVEVDLHADALLDTTAGLEPRDILDYQLRTFRATMEKYARHRGRKIVFIHGKGEGVLRAAIVKELKSRYRTCRWQDASFREYGFGATMVTIG